MTDFAAFALRVLAQAPVYQPRRGHYVPDWVREEAKRLKAEGMGQRRIAQRLGVTRQAVQQWQRRWLGDA